MIWAISSAWITHCIEFQAVDEASVRNLGSALGFGPVSSHTPQHKKFSALEAKHGDAFLSWDEWTTHDEGFISYDSNAAHWNAARGLINNWGWSHTITEHTLLWRRKKKRLGKNTWASQTHATTTFLASRQEQARQNVGFGILFFFFTS